VASEEVRTAGPAARVTLAPDRATIDADGDDLSFVTVRIEDRTGTLCPSADHLVRFAVSGAGFIQAVDNGNPATAEPFLATQRKAFSGMALLIVRSKPRERGKIQVTAAAEGLAPGKMEITAGR
jgi:beta-galactosidase